jgi:hypothetical protein
VARNIVLPEYNNPEEGYEQPLDPSQDVLAAHGFYPQVSTTPDLLVGVERDANGNLVFLDQVAGTKTLSELTGGGTGGIDPTQHDLLPTLVHDIIATTFDEVTYSGSLISQIISWTSSSKTQKVQEILLSYSASLLSQIVTKRYDAAGALVQQVTEVLAYSGGKVTSLSRTRNL